MIKSKLAAALVVTSLAAAVPAQAASVSVAFPSTTASVTGSVGFISPGQVGYFWSSARGDQVSESYAATGLFGATTLDLDLTVLSNGLASGQSVDWDVLVNGVDVGDWSWGSADGTGATHLSLSFAAIAGEFSSLALVVKNEVPPGAGAISLATGTRATLADGVSTVPEPGLMSLLGLALAGMAFARRRRG